MTDGRLYYGESQEPLRAFNIQDGLGVKLFQQTGGKIAILTGKQSTGVQTRARDLGIEHVIQGSGDKRADLERLMTKLGISAEETAMLGDDLPDLPAMRRCGYPMAVANGVDEVRETARYVTRRAGGDGAVRDAVEHLLRAAKQLDAALAPYLPPPAEKTASSA